MRTALVVAASTWAGLGAAGATLALAIHLDTSGTFLAVFRPVVTCITQQPPAADPDRSMRDFMNVPPAPMTGGRRY